MWTSQCFYQGSGVEKETATHMHRVEYATTVTKKNSPV